MSGDGLPLTIRGGALRPLRYEQPVSSAQIKSCLLLAGVTGSVDVAIREPFGRSRDHTERLLRAFGYRVEEAADGWVEMSPTGRIEPFALQVPGDPSSAAFLVGAALLAEGGELRISGVGVNPTRIGFLAGAGAHGCSRCASSRPSTEFGEPVGDLVVAPASLRATEVRAGEIPGLIDEIPLLAVWPRRAAGTTVFRDVGELRVKESDRLGLMAANLRAVGARWPRCMATTCMSADRIARRPDGCARRAITGSPWRSPCWAPCPGARITIDDMRCADVSFPRFRETLAGIRRAGARDAARHRGHRWPGGIGQVEHRARRGRGAGVRPPRLGRALPGHHARGAGRGGACRGGESAGAAARRGAAERGGPRAHAAAGWGRVRVLPRWRARPTRTCGRRR